MKRFGAVSATDLAPSQRAAGRHLARAGRRLGQSRRRHQEDESSALNRKQEDSAYEAGLGENLAQFKIPKRIFEILC